MWLIIDDVRDLGCDVIARTAAAGKRMLASGPWDVLCIDHDLGDVGAETGYDVIKWAIDNGIPLPSRIQIVSANPTGCENIAFLLKAAGYTPSPSSREFTRP